MMFTSAAFICIFMPLAIAVYYLTPSKYRKHLILPVSALFYILANIHSPLSVLILVAVALISYFAGMLAEKSKNRHTALIAAIGGIVIFAVLRIIGENVPSFVFPLGSAIWILSCVSYISDIANGNAQRGNFLDTMRYIMFFPVMAAGPVVKYRDFEDCISSPEYSINNFAGGVRFFALGCIERLAISAVLFEGYEKIILTSKDDPDIFFGLCVLMFIFLASYFAFAGIMDIGRGISLMLGIPLPQAFERKALWAFMPSGFLFSLFSGLKSWIDEYLISPLSEKIHIRNTRVCDAAVSSVTVILIALWIRSSLTALTVAAAVAMFVFVFRLLGLSEFLENNRGFRPIGFIFTFIIIIVLFTSCISESYSDFAHIFACVIKNSTASHGYYVHIAMAGRKYLITSVLAVVVALIAHNYRTMAEKFSARLWTVLEIVLSIVLLAFFAFTMLHFLPQYPVYGIRVFKYLIF